MYLIYIYIYICVYIYIYIPFISFMFPGIVLFRPSSGSPVLSSSPGDGTFVFQDLQGRAHHSWANNGTLIWKQGIF